jgi:V8-like Glu-specific endopeptidase
MLDELDFMPAALGRGQRRRPWREEEVLPPEDTRRCVSATNSAPFRYICAIRTPVSVSATRVGSGTLIGPRTVLTAGHNLAGVVPALTTVTPAMNGTAAPPFGASISAAFVMAPGFVEATATDYAVVVLANPVGLAANWWTFDFFRWPGDSVGTSVINQSEDVTGISVRVCGYPVDRPARTHLGGRLDACFVAAANPLSRKQYVDTNRAERITPTGIIEYENDTEKGQSGSPVWHERHVSLGRVLVGVHISRDNAEFPDKRNRGVYVQASVHEFVRAHSFFPPAAPPVGSAGRPTIRFGSKGGPVVELQYRLNIWLAVTPASGLPALKVDGIFGSKTLAATRAFQKAMSLLVDGIVGPKTWNRLLLPF